MSNYLDVQNKSRIYEGLIMKYIKNADQVNPTLFLKIETTDNTAITQSNDDNFIIISYFNTDIGTTGTLNEINSLQNDAGDIIVDDLSIIIPNRNEPCGVKAMEGFDPQKNIYFDITIKQKLSKNKEAWIFKFTKCKIKNLVLCNDALIFEFKTQSVILDSDKKKESINNEGPITENLEIATEAAKNATLTDQK
jgi:hypothetical protein